MLKTEAGAVVLFAVVIKYRKNKRPVETRFPH